MAIFVAVIVGLLQWPKETISVLIALFLLNLVGRYPIAAGIPVGIILLVGIPSSGRARGADVAIPEAGNR